MNTKSVKPAFKQAEKLPGVSPLYNWAKNRISVLDARLGVGVGAVNERARLSKHLKGVK